MGLEGIVLWQGESGLVGLDKWLCGAGQVAELGYTYKLVEWLGGAG